MQPHAECGPCGVRRRTAPVERLLALVVTLGALGALAVIFGGGCAGMAGATMPGAQAVLALLAGVALASAALLAALVSVVEPWLLARAKGTAGAGPAYRHASRCRRCGATPEG